MYNVPETKLFPPPQPDDRASPGSLQVHDTSDPLERRALHYFRTNTIADLSGFTTYTKAFWNSVIPGLSASEPAIRHIAIALAAQHESQRADSERKGGMSQFCFKHHSLALHSLSRSSPAQKEEILLVSCKYATEHKPSKRAHRTIRRYCLPSVRAISRSGRRSWQLS